MTRLFHIPSLILGALLVVAAPAQAELMTVETMGQAVETGLGKTVTRRRALEEALIEAAIKGGADINGYSAVSDGVLVSDRMVLRPASRILDYSILSEKNAGGVYRVRIRAIVGEMPAVQPCARRAQLDLTTFAPQITIDPRTPAWVAQLGPDLSQAIEDALALQPGVSVTRAARDAVPGRAAQVGYDMDYTALTRGISGGPKPTGGLTYRAKLNINMQGTDSLALSMNSYLIDGASQTTIARETQDKTVRLKGPLLGRSLNALLGPKRDKIVREMTDGIVPQISALISGYACRSLTGPLRLSGGALTLPFGSKDGLTRHHMAYSEGSDAPYVLFEIAKLSDHSVSLVPLDRKRSLQRLNGMQVRFMELGQ